MEKKILRVFPHRNNYTPNDDMVRIGFPDMLPLPDHDEVHISCTFTWDKELCEQMKLSWEMKTDKPVLLGGWPMVLLWKDSLLGCTLPRE